MLFKRLLAHPKFEKEFNPAPLESYLILQYNSSDESFFKGAYSPPPAHYFVYAHGKLTMERYADIHQRESQESLTQIVNDIDTAVQHSVAAHTIADVEVGSFLSAGVDSSYVAAVLRPDHTFSVGFPVPIKDWLREEQYYLRVRSLFAQPWVEQFFNQDELLSMIDNNYEGKTNDRRKIWTIFSFLTWYDVYFNHDGKKPQVDQ